MLEQEAVESYNPLHSEGKWHIKEDERLIVKYDHVI